MQQTIYIDVLAGINLFINYFLLLAVSKFLSYPVRRPRFIGAAALGALFSLSILLPELGTALSLLMKLVMSVLIILVAFGFGEIKFFLRAVCAFYIINFSFAGFMLVLWYFLAPQGLVIRNSIIYFDISPLLLIFLTVVCYFLITLFNRITGRQMPRELICRLTVKYAGHTNICVAKVDTGNSLKEPFSGFPVAVVYEHALSGIPTQKEIPNFRLVPYEAVSGDGLLPAFRPDLLTVSDGKKTYRTNHVYIAVTKTKPGTFDALLNPDLLQETPG